MQLLDRESPQRAAVVTGASGWLGRNLVRALVAAGAAITGVRERASTLEDVYFEIMGVRPGAGGEVE